MSNNRSWVIGNDPSCDVVVGRDFVSGRHCRLSQTPSGFVLEDLASTNGVYVNGERLTAARQVTPRDQVTLGQTTPMPWPPAALSVPPIPSPPPPPSLSAARVISVGRGPENDVVLDYPTVSTRHARVTIDGAGITIEDLGSTNGTFLGSLDRRITTRSPLAPSDTVFFGTQPIPASRLLGGAGAGGGTMAVTPAMLAAALATPTAPPPVAPSQPRAATVPMQRGPAGPASVGLAPDNGQRHGIPPLVLACAGVAALTLVVAVTVWAMRGTDEKPQARPDPDDPRIVTPDDGKPGAVDPLKAIYVVLVDSRGEKRVLGNIGTAAAIGDSRLVTSGGVATEVQRALAESWDVSVYCPTTKKEHKVARAFVNPEFESALGEFNKAKGEFDSALETLKTLQQSAESEDSKDNEGEKPDKKPKKESKKESKPPSKEELTALHDRAMASEDRMLKANERMIHYDLGSLQIEGRVEVKIPLVQATPSEEGVTLKLVGLPKDPADAQTTRSEIKQLVENTGKYYTRTAMMPGISGVPKQDTFLRTRTDERSVWNWAGGAVLDHEGRLVAVYSRVTPPLKANEVPDGKSNDLALVSRWLELSR